MEARRAELQASSSWRFNPFFAGSLSQPRRRYVDATGTRRRAFDTSCGRSRRDCICESAGLAVCVENTRPQRPSTAPVRVAVASSAAAASRTARSDASRAMARRRSRLSASTAEPPSTVAGAAALRGRQRLLRTLDARGTNASASSASAAAKSFKQVCMFLAGAAAAQMQLAFGKGFAIY